MRINTPKKQKLLKKSIEYKKAAKKGTPSRFDPAVPENQTPDQVRQRASVDCCVKIKAPVCGESAKSRLRAHSLVSNCAPLALVSASQPIVPLSLRREAAGGCS